MLRANFVTFSCARKASNLYFLNKRTMYTEQFLGLVTVKTAQEKELSKLLELQSVENLQRKTIASADEGLLLSTELESISCMVRSESDLALYNVLIKRFIELHQHSKISLLNVVGHVTKYYQLCHLMDAPDLAVEMFEDEHVKEVISLNKTLAGYSHLLLLNLLFKSKKFTEVIRVFEYVETSEVDNNDMFNCLTVAMLALTKLNDNSAYGKATQFMDTYLSVPDPVELLSESRGPLTYIYAWIACKDINYPAAYEIINADPSPRKLSLKTNLKLFTLLKLERTRDVILLLEDLIEERSSRTLQQKPKFCRELIELMVKSAKESLDEELISRMKIIFSKLDTVAEVSGYDLEDLLFVPIDEHVNKRKVSEIESLRQRYRPGKEY